ncbi:CPBP family intramembrane metalloprotease [Caulobacter sp. SL161]|uniref:CPBP family intramembrane glutamic endopeptidase n=1 Tax=Caulobacter sp. SL161 TaxID=2995156 RepID=UPI0022761489|nr:CPBP family intramembrane glutamic endopeptidase [Caulobacter sp. SL161]MCY1646282.1 CPBP family intramembrane metalloprotease [Caulobacter sp. SL161]
MRMGGLMETVRRSRFLADLSPHDRDPRRTALVIPVGILTGAVTGLLGALAAVLAFMLVVGGLDGAAAATDLFQVFSKPDLAEPTGPQSLFILACLAGMNLGAAIGFVMAAAAIQRRPFGDYINDGQPLRWRLVLGGLVLVGVVMAVVIGLVAVVSGHVFEPVVLKVSPNLVGRSLYAIIAIVLLILASAAEELLFRGWLLKQSAAYIRNPIALMALNGLLFAAIHLDPNLDAFLFRAAMGAGLTWMALRLGGIELGIGVHAANNAAIVLLLRPITLQPDAAREFQPGLVASAVVMLAGFIGISELWMRWPALRRWTGLSAPAAA